MTSGGTVYESISSVQQRIPYIERIVLHNRPRPFMPSRSISPNLVDYPQRLFVKPPSSKVHEPPVTLGRLTPTLFFRWHAVCVTCAVGLPPNRRCERSSPSDRAGVEACEQRWFGW